MELSYSSKLGHLEALDTTIPSICVTGVTLEVAIESVALGKGVRRRYWKKKKKATDAHYY